MVFLSVNIMSFLKKVQNELWDEKDFEIKNF